jgi:hypothetical protein
MACKPLGKNIHIGLAAMIAAVIGVAPSAMAQTNNQKSQSSQNQSSQSQSSQSSGSNSQSGLDNFLGAVGTFVNKSTASNTSSTDGQTKTGKTGSQGAGSQGTGKQVATKNASDPPDTDDVGKSLADLKDYYERGLITKPEYDAKRKELLSKIH